MHHLHPTASGIDQVAANKSVMRRTIGLARDGIDPSARVHQTHRCLTQLLTLPAYQRAQRLLCTVSFGSELDTSGIIDRARADGKHVVLPRVDKSSADLLLFLTDTDARLETSSWGIAEPPLNATMVDSGELDLVIVPGLAFDRAGNRLGYGRGYFDRLLAQLPVRATRVALCFECQVVDAVPVLDTDEKIDILVTVAAVTHIPK